MPTRAAKTWVGCFFACAILNLMNTKPFPKLDKSVFSVVSLEEADNDEMEYWRSKTPYERLDALETLRQIFYGYDPITTRLQRVLEITERT
jgi:hypothetical protein